jgi:hypothetical protein
MAQYLIESKHTKEQCLQALDNLLDKGPDVLNKFEFGCMAGDHTGWATVEADNQQQAEELIPKPLRSQTRVVQVSKFTPEQIRSYHNK